MLTSHNTCFLFFLTCTHIISLLYCVHVVCSDSVLHNSMVTVLRLVWLHFGCTSFCIVSCCRVGLRQVVESIIASQEEKMNQEALYQVRQTEKTEGGGYFWSPVLT